MIYPYWENAARMAESYAALYLLLGTLLAIMPVVCLTIVLVKFITGEVRKGYYKASHAIEDRVEENKTQTLYRRRHLNTNRPALSKEPAISKPSLQGICYLTCHRVQPVSYAVCLNGHVEARRGQIIALDGGDVRIVFDNQDIRHISPSAHAAA